VAEWSLLPWSECGQTEEHNDVICACAHFGDAFMVGNVERFPLLAQRMNQMPVQGTVPFNIIKPRKFF